MTTGTPEQPNPYAVELVLAAALAKVVDAQDADITRAWATAWSEISADLLDILNVILADVGRVNASAVVRYERLARVLAGIADRLDDLAGGLAATVTNDLADVLAQAKTGTVELIAAQRLARGVPGREVPTRALEAIVRRTTEQVTSVALPLADETYAVILGELTRGVAAGDNPRQTAARMVDRAENHFNFGRSRAVTIARTETLDAYREGARVTQLAHADLLAGWAWLAHLGPRTCRSCLAMHGQIFDLEIPGPDDHQQGRCTRMPVVREEDGSVDLTWLPTAEEHFAGLDQTDQRAILGRKGYDAWVAGDFPIEDWTKRRETEWWRGSQVPASPGDPDAGSGGGGTVPPVNNGDDNGGPEDPDDVAARLNEAYAAWVEDLTDDQLSAIAAWQGTDRHYDELQSAFRGDNQTVSKATRQEIRALRRAIHAGELPFNVVGWKGVRSVRRVFGVSAAELEVGTVVPYQGFFAFTIDRDIATPEFTHPPGPPAAGVLRMDWPAGSKLAWVAAAGDPHLYGQLELLASPGLSLQVVSVTYPDGDDAAPEIHVEVITR